MYHIFENLEDVNEEKIFENLKSVEPEVWINTNGNLSHYNIHLQNHYFCGNLNIDKPKRIIKILFTKEAWEQVKFNFENVEISCDKYGFDYNMLKNPKVKEQFDLCKKLWSEHLEKNKDLFMKLIKSRIKQIKKNANVVIKKDNQKKDTMNDIVDKLINNGFQVSKVYHKGWSESSFANERKIPDKLHKYIDTKDVKSITFASVEIKIGTGKNNFKMGCKIKTKGTTGCVFEDLEKITDRIKIEYEKLNNLIKDL
jgi:hypothetical protein